MSKALLLFFILFLGCLVSHGQSLNPKVDSLQKILQNDLTDEQKCAVLAELAWETRVTNLDKAERYATEALTLAEKISDEKKKASVYNTLGNIKKDKANFNEAMKYYLMALRIQDKFGDKKAISAGYINISNIHYYTNNYPKALEYLKKALAIKTELNDEKGIAGCLNNIANVLMNQKKLDSALKYFHLSLDMRLKIGNKQGISASLANLAGLYSQMNQHDIAIPYFEKAIALKKEIGDSLGMISTLINSANSYKDIGQKARARKLFDEALVIGRKLDAKDDLKNALSGMASLNYADKKFEEAYKNLEQYIQINDSIINEEVTRSQAEMSTKYETEKKEKEIELLNKDKLLQNAEIQQQRTFRNLSLAVGFLVTLLAGALFFAFRQKHRTNLVLTLQKAEILEKNSILTIQKEEIQVQKNEITDSINYAKRIQDSILPSEEEMLKCGRSGFILYKPKDIVSGDFYWCHHTGNKSYLVAADSTGHGVPGALMSMIGAEKLSAAIKENESPSRILTSLNTKIRAALKQDQTEVVTGDGMDLAMLMIDKNSGKAFFSGANRPLWFTDQKGGIVEIKGNKLSIGGSTESDTSFEEKEIPLTSGTRFYLFSDGFADQFGGADGKKLMKKNLRALVESIQHLALKDHKHELDRFFTSWKNEHEQVDDVMVIGIEV